MSDPLLEAIKAVEEEDQKKQRLSESMAFGLSQNPDARAKAQRVAKKVGTSPGFALENLEEFERGAKRNDLNPEAMIKGAPKVSSWLAEPENAAVAMDEIDRLMAMEGAFGRAKSSAALGAEESSRKRGVTWYGNIGSTLGYGLSAMFKAVPGAASSLEDFTYKLAGAKKPAKPEGMTDIEWALAQSVTMPGSASFKLAGAIAGEAEQFYQSGQYATESLTIRDPVTGSTFTNWDAANPFTKAGLLNTWQLVVGETPATAVQLGLTALTKGAAAPALAPKVGKLVRAGKFLWERATSPAGIMNTVRVMSGQRDQAVQELMAQGLSKEDAEVQASSGVLLSGVFSTFAGSPLDVATNQQILQRLAASPAGQTFLKKVAQRAAAAGVSGAAEGMQEALEGASQDFAAMLTYSPDQKLNEFLAKRMQDFSGGAAMGAGAKLTVSALQGSKGEDVIKAVGDTAQDSKLAQRSPEKFKEAIKEMAQGTEHENMRYDAQTFFQDMEKAGLDPADIAQKIGATNLAEAMAAGTDLIFPTADFAVAISQSPDLFEVMAPNIKFGLGGVSAAEFDAYEAEAAKVDLKEEVPPAQVEPYQVIYEQTRKQLREAGNTPSVADTLADRHARVMVNMAKDFGQDPLSLNEKYAMRVFRPSAEEAGKGETRLDQSKNAGILEEGGPSDLQTIGEPRAARGQGPEGKPGLGGNQALDAAGLPRGRQASGQEARSILDHFDTEAGLEELNQAEHVYWDAPKTVEFKSRDGSTHPYEVDVQGRNVTVRDPAPGVHDPRGMARVRVLPSGYLHVLHVTNQGRKGSGLFMYQEAIKAAKEAFPEVTDESMVIGDTSEEAISARTKLGPGTDVHTNETGAVSATPVSNFSGTRTLFQSAKAPVFFSALQRTISDISKIANKEGMIDVGQAKTWLAARQKEGKFKQAEMEAVGLPEWLDLQNGKVSVDDITSFVEQNGVHIQEIEKGNYYEYDIGPSESLRGKFDVIERSTDRVVFTGSHEEAWSYSGDKRRAVAPHYENYQLGSGGKNYRELLLTLPRSATSKGQVKAVDSGFVVDGREDLGVFKTQSEASSAIDKNKIGTAFSSHHWDEPNILSHIRFNERTDAEGKKVLFIEEIQSDWGQKGKKEGFALGAPTEENIDLKFIPPNVPEGHDPKNYPGYWEAHDKRSGDLITRMPGDTPEIKAMNEALNWGRDKANRKVPSAPFVTDTKAWVALSIKRMIRYAAENGFDKVAFINGEQSADRYDLSKHVEKVSAWLGTSYNGLYDLTVTDKKGGTHSFEGLTESALEDHVGKDLAKKIVDQQSGDDAEAGFHASGLDLKVGGEGMKAFYDKIVPSVAGDVIKKFGGKISSTDIEVIEVDDKAFGGTFRRPKKVKQTSFDVTEGMRKRVLSEGQPLFQDKRGYIQFGEDRKMSIAMLENANLSTFIHETGHMYLEVMGDLAEAEGAAGEGVEAYGKILKFLGVENRGQIKREHHEKFARAMEAYAREGKAPTQELRSAFQKVKFWMMQVYKSLEALAVKLNPEIRAVFDRMFAGEEAVNQAQRDVSVQPLYATAEDMGVTEAEFAAYSKLAGKVISAARDAVDAQLIKEYQRTKEEWWETEKDKVRSQVALEIDADPAYRAFKVLTDGKLEDGSPIKLNKAALTEQFGEGITKQLKKAKGWLYTREGGLDPESAAEILGFGSGVELINALTGLEPRKDAIERMADERMKAEHGDLLQDGTVVESAVEAIHNDARADLIAAELGAMYRKMRGKMPPMGLFRDSAREIITETSPRNLEPYRYLKAGEKAVRDAVMAVKKGDDVAALQAKRKHLLNHYLYLEAVKAKEEAEEVATYARKAEGTKFQEMLGKAGLNFQEQFNALSGRYEFRKVSNKELDERTQSLEAWVNEQQDLEEGISIDPVLFIERQKNWREVPMGELRAVRDALKNIEAVARQQLRMIVNGKAVEFEKIREIFDTWTPEKERTPLKMEGDKTTILEDAAHLVRGVDANLLKVEWMVYRFDRGDINGPMRTYIKNGVDDAVGRKQELLAGIQERLNKLQSERDPKYVNGGGKETAIQFPKRNRPLTYDQIVSWVLNMGTEENRKVALLGEGLVDGDGTVSQAATEALSSLPASELKFVQGVWDTLETLREPLAAEHRRKTGLPLGLKELTPFSVVSSDGETVHLRGGYYPLAASNVTSIGKMQDDPLSMPGMGRNRGPRVATGMTKQVTGATYQLKLDFSDVLSKHLEDTVTNIAFGEVSQNVSKILNDDVIYTALSEKLGREYVDTLKGWLTDTMERPGDAPPQDPVISVINGFKNRATISVLAGSVVSLAVQISDFVKPLVAPGISNLEFVKARYDMTLHGAEITEQVRKLSPNVMRYRGKNFNREIRDSMVAQGGFQGKNKAVSHYLMNFFSVMDAQVSVPTWLAVYRKGLKIHGNEAQAIREANSVVERTLQGGDPKSMSAMFRSRNGWQRLFTTFQNDGNTWYGIISSAVASKDVGRISAALMGAFVGQALGQMLKRRGPDEEDEKEWWIKQGLLVPINSLPIVGGIIDTSLSVSGKRSGGDFATSSMGGAAQALVDPFKDWHNKGWDELDWEDVAMSEAQALGTFGGIPGTAQILRSWKYNRDVRTGRRPKPDSALEEALNTVMPPPRER